MMETWIEQAIEKTTITAINTADKTTHGLLQIPMNNQIFLKGGNQPYKLH